MERERTKQITAFIVRHVGSHPSDIAAVAAEAFGISRQAVSRHLRRLVQKKVLEAVGRTRNRTYRLLPRVDKTFPLLIGPALAEDRVWREHLASLFAGVRPNVVDICHHGFTEMFNNVLDHSEGTFARIELTISAASVLLRVWDNGVGIFAKIKRELNLEDERHAILELAKGKLTTDPARHTGEGIFFTSRMFENFQILSSGLFFSHEAPDDDWLLEASTDLTAGTSVSMQIPVDSARTAKEVFDKYASVEGDYSFTKTHVPVKLLRYGHENLVSRSQAKRLLARFERFEEVFLDFDGVETVGQAFADEIFRVFRRQNPQVKLVYARASEQVKGMIRRALTAI